MKTKVSQKEWNDKRDAFLCAIIQTYEVFDHTDIIQADRTANKLTSELYEVKESDLVKWKINAEEDYLTTPISVLRYIGELEKSLNLSSNETVEETIDVDSWSDDKSDPQPTDTRPFNPKVVEIFNTYLPKEIAPLAIEAHKRSCGVNARYNRKTASLENALYDCISWSDFSIELGNWSMLHRYISGNAITATPEQLREWFPSAYEGGTND